MIRQFWLVSLVISHMVMYTLEVRQQTHKSAVFPVLKCDIYIWQQYTFNTNFSYFQSLFVFMYIQQMQKHKLQQNNNEELYKLECSDIFQIMQHIYYIDWYTVSLNDFMFCCHHDSVETRWVGYLSFTGQGLWW